MEKQAEKTADRQLEKAERPVEKASEKSADKPLAYYANNVGGLLTVCQAMQRQGVKRFVFSSSATVYGDPEALFVRQ